VRARRLVTTNEDRTVAADRLVAAHEHARAFYRQQLQRAPAPRRYLQARGLGAFVRLDAGAPWYLGYAPPGWTSLVDHLAQLGFTPQELLAAGLATTTRDRRIIDRFRDRIMFPIHTRDGQPVGFIGRAAPAAGRGVPKYLNTPDTPIFHKGHILYGLGEQRARIAAGAAPVVVEGPFDVIALHLAYLDGETGGHVGVAPCGSTLTATQATTIADLPGARRGVAIAYDNDRAGRTATLRAFDLLPHHLTLTAATLPDGHDPADFVTTPESLHTLRSAISDHARPLAEVVLDIELGRTLARHPDALQFIETRLDLVRHLAARIAHLPPPQVVHLADHIAAHTGTPLETVTQAIIDALETAS